MSERNDTEAASELQNGETFNDEMKDYAKSTMNELLGIFGYKEEITREAVEELQIRLLPEEDEEHLEQKSEEPEKSVTSSGESAAVALDLQGSTMPVIVQVEGCNSDGRTNVVPLTTGNNVVKACTQPDKIPVSCVQQAAVVAEGVPGSTSDSKATSVLAPHFLVNPPNIQGVYCVVANLPVVNNNGKTNMTFKFWNCIMCSEYFIHKPEVVFRVEHPHLFNSQPAWLYQAAVCQKCYHSLKSVRQGTLAPVSKAELLRSSSSVVVSVPKEKNQGVLTKSVTVSCVSDAPAVHLVTRENILAVKSSNTVLDCTEHNEVDRKEVDERQELLFECFVCSKPVKRNSRYGRLRRSKFPTLFSSFPENVGMARVCFICSERLARQRDRYVCAGISEEDRDYVAHIKIWTGQDFGSKSFASSAISETNSGTICFICEKFIPDTSPDRVKNLLRSKYPSLFSIVPDHAAKLVCCDVCSRKLQKVKNRFDENNVKEEERDYWAFVNSWRDKKGLEKHLYSR